MASKVNGNADSDVNELRAQIDTLKSDISELTHLVGEMGRRRRDEAGNEVNRRARELRFRAERGGAAAREHASDLQASFERQVRDQPAAAAAIAAGVGFLAGFLTARK